MATSIGEKLGLAIVALVLLFDVSSAIFCYQCNSEYDPRCGSPFDSYSLGQVNCSMKTKLEHLPGQEPVMCRKTIQKIFGKIRVIRDCGYLSDNHLNHECLKKSGTFEVQSLYCTCTGDLCNSSPNFHQQNFNKQFFIIVSFLCTSYSFIYFGRFLFSEISMQ